MEHEITAHEMTILFLRHYLNMNWKTKANRKFCLFVVSIRVVNS